MQPGGEIGENFLLVKLFGYTVLLITIYFINTSIHILYVDETVAINFDSQEFGGQTAQWLDFQRSS